jgi:alkanesulfonate monooxygenase SsuD/methylene tetrahydromethanopterin reductase-like flavin-dependent oxidoreductase (luciferase family)
MQIGFLTDLRNATDWERPWNRHYGHMLEVIEEVERLGAAAIFLGEHHLTPDGYLPQPLAFAAAIAARTTRIRIGTSVVVAPLRHPMHLAEEAAVVDVLSGGRLELGMGAGYVPEEFEAFGVERADRFKLLDRSVAEVRRLLEIVTPRPIQERVPIWCGYFGTGARRAGLLGEGLFSLQRNCLDLYREGLAAGGHDPASARMSGPLDLVVVDDPERARAELQPHVEYQAAAYGIFQKAAARAEGREPRLAGTADASSFLILSPEQAVKHIRARTEGLPVTYVAPWLSVGGMPDAFVEEHVRLTLTEVAPALATGWTQASDG